MKIVFIGAGNVATHLATEFYQKGVEIIQVYSRTKKSAKELAEKTNADYTNDLSKIYKEADVYVYSVSDDVLFEVISNIKVADTLHIHTSGSSSLDIFFDSYYNTGVLYPLQTFSKNKKVSFSKIPFFIEGANEEKQEQIRTLASLLSEKIYIADSERRKKLHIAAVFVCNFVNHMYEIGAELIAEAGFSFDVLRPLIEETTEKISILTPYQAQTGPAVRNDRRIIEEHLQALEDKRDLADLYSIINEDIFFTHSNKDIEE